MQQPIMINKILAKKGYLLVLEFNNGERRFIDFLEYLKKYKNNANHKLFNSKEFKKIKVKNGTLVWSNTKRIIEINGKKFIDYYNPDPYLIYQESKPMTWDFSNDFFKLLLKYDDNLKAKYKRKKPDLVTFSKILVSLF